MPEIRVIRVDSDAEFDAAFEIRRVVFQEGQGVPEEVEVDGHDHIAHHYLALCEDVPCGTARWRVTPGRRIKLERFAVLPEHRGQGVGEALVKAVTADLPAGPEVILHAQMPVIGFYEKLGFLAEGEEFEEGGLMHRVMRLPR